MTESVTRIPGPEAATNAGGTIRRVGETDGPRRVPKPAERCTGCKGTGVAGGRPKGHRTGCTCFVCGRRPCKVCGGTGFAAEPQGRRLVMRGG